MDTQAPAPRASRTTLALELAAVLTTTMGPSLFRSLFVWRRAADFEVTPDKVLPGLALYGGGILLVLALARKGNEPLKEFGLRAPKKSLLWAIPIYVAGAVCLALGTLFVDLFTPALERTAIHFPFSWAGVAYSVVAPAWEEIVTRAYLMTRLRQLGAPVAVAFVVTVGLETVGHLYQGLPAALALTPFFVLYTAFFAWKRNALPLVVAHVAFDALMLWRAH